MGSQDTRPAACLLIPEMRVDLLVHKALFGPGLGQHGFISIKMLLEGREQGGPSNIVPKKIKAFLSLYSWVLLRGRRNCGSEILKHTRKNNRISGAQKGLWRCQRGDLTVFKNCNKAVKAWMSFKWKSQIHLLFLESQRWGKATRVNKLGLRYLKKSKKKKKT